MNDLSSLCTGLETRVYTRKRDLILDFNEIEQKHVRSNRNIKLMLHADMPASKSACADVQSRTFTIPLKCKLFQCLLCPGDVRLPWDNWLYAYGSRDLLKRHFHRRHKTFRCDSPCPHPDPQCAKVVLISGTQFLSHAGMVHCIFMDAKR